MRNIIFITIVTFLVSLFAESSFAGSYSRGYSSSRSSYSSYRSSSSSQRSSNAFSSSSRKSYSSSKPSRSYSSSSYSSSKKSTPSYSSTSYSSYSKPKVNSSSYSSYSKPKVADTYKKPTYNGGEYSNKYRSNSDTYRSESRSIDTSSVVLPLAIMSATSHASSNNGSTVVHANNEPVCDAKCQVEKKLKLDLQNIGNRMKNISTYCKEWECSSLD